MEDIEKHANGDNGFKPYTSNFPDPEDGNGDIETAVYPQYGEVDMSRQRSDEESEDYSFDYAGDPFTAALGAANAPGKTGMFIDAASMKEKLRQNMTKPQYDVANFYHKTGIFRYIATNKFFEGATLSIIALNALWISIDTDHNDASILLTATPLFQFMEHFFCCYFTFEWFVRYCAFKRKRNGCKDAWFVFDSFMVFMMVGETWVMTIIMLATGAGGGGGMGNASILRLARLLRLSRMMRMAKLLRAMPELLILIKGIVAAMRSVFFVMCLLAIITYVFGIMFTQLLADVEAPIRLKFETVPLSMHTLILDGTFLDNLGEVVRALGTESLVFAAIFYVFVLLSALTVLNMLIGVLCEVVSAVAATENESLTIQYVHEKLQEVMKHSGLDEDGDGEISKDEFCKILELPEACRCLQEVGVDVMGLIDIADFIFDESEDDSGEPKNLSFQDFCEVILSLRGSNTATVKDIVDLRKFIVTTNSRLEEKLNKALATNVRKSIACMGSRSSSKSVYNGRPEPLLPDLGQLSSPKSVESGEGRPRSHTHPSHSNGDAHHSAHSALRQVGFKLDPEPDGPAWGATKSLPLVRICVPEDPKSNARECSPGENGQAPRIHRKHKIKLQPTVDNLLQSNKAALDELIQGVADSLSKLDSDKEMLERRNHIPGVTDTDSSGRDSPDHETAAVAPDSHPASDDDGQQRSAIKGSTHRDASQLSNFEDVQRHASSRHEMEELQRQLIRLKEAISNGLPAVWAAQKHLAHGASGSLSPLSPKS